MADHQVNLTLSSDVDKNVNDTIQSEADVLNATTEAIIDHPSTNNLPDSDVNLAGIRIEGDSGGSGNFGSSVFVFVVGEEKKVFAVHESKLTAFVLMDMCENKRRNQQEYRIELPDIEEYIFAAAVSYMYEYSLEAVVRETSMMEGNALGSLYVFASKFKMKVFQFTILEELAVPYKTPLILLQAAKIVYNELKGDELFRLFFMEHIVGRLCSFPPGQYREADHNKVDVAEWAAEGGLFGSDLTEAMLAALLEKKLSLVSTQPPEIVYPSWNPSWLSGRLANRPMAPQPTAIALRDWDGGNFSTLSFREGDRITEVRYHYQFGRPNNAWLWSGIRGLEHDAFPARYVRLEYPEWDPTINDWVQAGQSNVSVTSDEHAPGSENEDGWGDASEKTSEGTRERFAHTTSKDEGMRSRFGTW